MTVTIDNIEDHLHLFNDKNTDFGSPTWAEPIYAAMIRAYQNDEQLDVTIGNGYTRKVIQEDYTPNKTYSPIERVSSRKGLEAISTHITSIMMQNFSNLEDEDKRDLKDYLQYLFLELMNNIADHSHSPVGGYTMAQHFGKRHKIQFVAVDRGVGFLENMLLNFSDVEDEEAAIRMALEKGITSTRQKMYGHEKNAGFGLYAMFEILKMTGGKFVIISNDTLLRYVDGKFETKKLETPWQGVVVAFDFFETEINHDMDYFRRTYLWGSLSKEDDEDFF